MTPHPLKHPITIGKESTKTISSLNLKEFPTAEDYLAFDIQGRNAQLQALIASMTNTDISIIQKLHGEDYKELSLICDRLVYPEFYAAATPAEGQAAAEKKETAS